MLNRLSLLPLLFCLSACGATSEVAINEPLPTARPIVTETPKPMAESAVKDSPSPLASAPLASSSPSPASSPSAAPTTVAPVVLKQGAFRNGFHKVSGQAQILQIEGRSVLRLENFYTENGPDLYVYLVRNETGTPRNDQDQINLGKLRSTTGSFNVDIPAGVDLSGVQSATIWCQAFRVNFGFARFQTP